jgi:hypothetical protein
VAALEHCLQQEAVGRIAALVLHVEGYGARQLLGRLRQALQAGAQCGVTLPIARRLL